MKNKMKRIEKHSARENSTQLTNIAFVQERVNQILSQEYELTRVYMATPNEANWNALSDIRRHGALQEEHLHNLQQSLLLTSSSRYN